MTHIATRLTALLTAAMLTTGFWAQAQETQKNTESYPCLFIGLQGGAQTTFTDYNNLKLITPTASVSAGVLFNPLIGARLHVNGIWNKSGICGEGIDMKYKYKYVTTDLDLMVNMVNLFSKKNSHPLDVYLIGGIGLNYVWDNDDLSALSQWLTLSSAKNRYSHNLRVGGMLDYKVARNWSINLEVSANTLNDRYNCKTNSGSDDWQLTAQLGVTYRFHLPHKVKEAPESIITIDPSTIGTNAETASAGTDVAIDKPAPAPTPEPTPAPAPVVKDITRNIFFGLRQTEVTATEQVKLKEVADWLKEHPSAKVTVTGYADKGTGNAETNARYARQRAEAVTKLLTKKYGIEPGRITTSSKGDVVQPFPDDNDKNRVTIVIGKE